MLYIAGYSDIGSTTRGSIAIPLEPPLSEQAIEVGPASVQSDPFPPLVCLVKLLSDEDCMIDIGPAPDAINSVRKLNAGSEKIVSIPAGKNFRIAVTATGAAASNMGSVTGMDSLEALVKVLASPDAAQKQFAVIQANVDKMNATVADLRKASEENAGIRDQLIAATNEAHAANDAAKKAAADVAEREARLDKDTRDQADKAAVISAGLDARSKDIAAQEADVAANLGALNKKGSDLADLAANLDAKAKDQAAKEADLALREADYADRKAKLKALMG